MSPERKRGFNVARVECRCHLALGLCGNVARTFFALVAGKYLRAAVVVVVV